MPSLRPRLPLAMLLLQPLLAQTGSRPESRGPAVVAGLRAEADALRPLATSALTKAFLDATAALPEPEPRVVHQRRSTREFVSPAAFQALAAQSLPDFERVTITPARYYTTFYGSPLAYLRA